jgi:hypothetical protein
MDDICQKGDILTEKKGNRMNRNGNLGLFSEALAKKSLFSEALASLFSEVLAMENLYSKALALLTDGLNK